MALIGYARVSTGEQEPALQHDALGSAGCGRVFEDRGVSGAKADRPGLNAALAFLREGDVLVVWKLDRLGRSMSHLIATVEALERRGIGFRSLTEAIDTTTPGGRLVFHIFGALGQFERDLIRERTRAGLSAAAARGRKGGRKPVMTPEKLRRAQALLQDKLTVVEVAARLKVGKTALYASLKATEAEDATDAQVAAPPPAPPMQQAPAKRKLLSRRKRETAILLQRYLGSEVGVRYAAGAIAEGLPRIDQRTPYTGQLVQREMTKMVALGLAEPSPGPRGGAGWQLTAKGKALIAQLY
jgi:DNA invertase Pin-like site-specific DNA recombinase